MARCLLVYVHVLSSRNEVRGEAGFTKDSRVIIPHPIVSVCMEQRSIKVDASSMLAVSCRSM